MAAAEPRNTNAVLASYHGDGKNVQDATCIAATGRLSLAPSRKLGPFPPINQPSSTQTDRVVVRLPLQSHAARRWTPGQLQDGTRKAKTPGVPQTASGRGSIGQTAATALLPVVRAAPAGRPSQRRAKMRPASPIVSPGSTVQATGILTLQNVQAVTQQRQPGVATIDSSGKAGLPLGCCRALHSLPAATAIGGGPVGHSLAGSKGLAHNFTAIDTTASGKRHEFEAVGAGGMTVAMGPPVPLPNPQDPRFVNVLHAAVEAGKAAMVAALMGSVGYGLRHVDYGGDGGRTALHIAASCGHEALVELLIEHGADVDRRTNSGWTPLHRAAAAGHYYTSCSLIDAGADVKAVGPRASGFPTPVLFAARLGNPDMVALFHEAGADVNDTFYANLDSLLHVAANSAHGSPDRTIAELVEAGADINRVNVCGETALHIACMMGNSLAVGALCRRAADPTLVTERGFAGTGKKFSPGHVVGNQTCAHYAALCGGDVSMRAVLTSHGELVSSYDENGESPLQVVCRDVPRKLATSLQRFRSTQAEQRRQALIAAQTAPSASVSSNTAVSVDVSSDSGSDEEDEAYGQTGVGRTAAARDKVACASLLVRFGANVNHKSDSGGTALQNALCSLQPLMIPTLLSHGADPAQLQQDVLNRLGQLQHGSNSVRVLSCLRQGKPYGVDFLNQVPVLWDVYGTIKRPVRSTDAPLLARCVRTHLDTLRATIRRPKDADRAVLQRRSAIEATVALMRLCTAHGAAVGRLLVPDCGASLVLRAAMRFKLMGSLSHDAAVCLTSACQKCTAPSKGKTAHAGTEIIVQDPRTIECLGMLLSLKGWSTAEENTVGTCVGDEWPAAATHRAVDPTLYRSSAAVLASVAVWLAPLARRERNLVLGDCDAGDRRRSSSNTAAWVMVVETLLKPLCAVDAPEDACSAVAEALRRVLSVSMPARAMLAHAKHLNLRLCKWLTSTLATDFLSRFHGLRTVALPRGVLLPLTMKLHRTVFSADDDVWTIQQGVPTIQQQHNVEDKPSKARDAGGERFSAEATRDRVLSSLHAARESWLGCRDASLTLVAEIGSRGGHSQSSRPNRQSNRTLKARAKLKTGIPSTRHTHATHLAVTHKQKSGALRKGVSTTEAMLESAAVVAIS